jgi:hypothetical protein
MTLPTTAILLTALCACGFAAAGDVLLRRRSAGALGWNEAFLVGAGSSAAVLFPLSLIAGRRALGVLMILLGLAIAASLVTRIRRPPLHTTKPARVPHVWADLLLFVAIVLAVAAFATLSFRYTFFWDGFQIYASKAKRLFYEGGLTRDWFGEDDYDRRLLQYPSLVAMCEAMLARLRGRFDFDHFKPLFPLFYVSMLLSTFAAIRARGTRLAALCGTLLVALLPELATTQAAGGSSDLPLAAFVAGTVAAGLRRRSRRALPFLIGGLTVVKNEGTILAIIASGAVLAYWSAGGPRRLLRRLKARGMAVAIVAAFLGTRFAFLRWLDVQDHTYGSLSARHLARAAERFETVLRVCGRLALDPEVWGLLWPVAFVAGVVLAVRGTRTERALAGALWTSVAAYTAIFLFTNWDVELQAVQAYTRLLSQLAPAAIVAIALSYGRVRHAIDLRFPPIPESAALPRGHVGR